MPQIPDNLPETGNNQDSALASFLELEENWLRLKNGVEAHLLVTSPNSVSYRFLERLHGYLLLMHPTLEQCEQFLSENTPRNE